ncbi:hypothetical protein COO60DRAFT_1628580 [Scenedesmus sp. NREL 46B-D3]|nr:hypothetical protein COO60DRAFT_1628580 [Scenedesmus sp. NREL 46B-D3]
MVSSKVSCQIVRLICNAALPPAFCYLCGMQFFCVECNAELDTAAAQCSWQCSAVRCAAVAFFGLCICVSILVCAHWSHEERMTVKCGVVMCLPAAAMWVQGAAWHAWLVRKSVELALGRLVWCSNGSVTEVEMTCRVRRAGAGLVVHCCPITKGRQEGTKHKRQLHMTARSV